LSAGAARPATLSIRPGASARRTVETARTLALCTRAALAGGAWRTCALPCWALPASGASAIAGLTGADDANRRHRLQPVDPVGHNNLTFAGARLDLD
jgi:hypothetical protein